MRKLLAALLLQCLCYSAVFAQSKEISGRVVDSATGEPISGASVLTNKKGTAGTTTAEGNFLLKADSKVTTLIVSSVGYVPRTLPAASLPAVIRLSKAEVNMEEVVVIGYGTQRKSNVTGAIGKYSNQRMDEQPVSRIDQALQGKIAGVQIQNVSSEAGSDPRINVRGLSSVNAGTGPLVVIDGHPQVQDGLSFVNPADVASVEVLKDAASAAIYGSRGASGVILITTKSGKADRTRYTVKASSGLKRDYKRYDMLTMTDYANLLFYEASLRAKDPTVPANQHNLITGNERAAYVIENTIAGGPTDWQEQALRTANPQNLQMNVSGGNKGVRYFISGGFQNDPGIMYHSEYKKYNLRTKLDANLSNRVKLSLNLNPSYISRERPGTGYIDFVRFYSFLPVYHTDATAAFVNANGGNVRVGDFVQANDFNNRSFSGTMPDGSVWTSNGNVQPFQTSNNTPKSVLETRRITSNEYRMLSSADLTVNILKGLDFKTLASAYVAYTSALDFAKRNSNRQGDLNRGLYNDRRLVDLLTENTLTYNKSWSNHELTVLAGFTSQKTRVRSQQAVGQDYPSDNITSLNTALIKDQANTWDSTAAIGLNSVLSRVQYAFKNKYLLSASLRWDGSSFFAAGKKWAAFPSISAGWVLTQEKFFEKAVWLNNLKLRASYGISGNNRILDQAALSPYPFVDLLYAANYSFGSGLGTVNQGFTPSSQILANPDLTWETTNQYNAGIDISVFKNTLALSIDVYHSQSRQLLLRQNGQLFAGVTQFWNNIGKLQNRGVEVELTANVLRSKLLRWNISGNIARNRNRLIEFGGESRVLNLGERNEVYMNVVGNRPFIQFYGYKTDGVWLSQQQIDEARARGLTSALSNLFVPGGLKLVDVNGDNVIDPADRVVMGNPYPDFIYGLTNSFTYNGFDLSFMFQGSQGGSLINGDPNYNETKRINRNYIENRWISPANPGDGKTPYSTNGFNWMLTDYVVEDASYLALREVIVGYTLPQRFTSKAHLQSARLYFSAQNLWFRSASSYRGINPEGRFSTGPYTSPLLDGYQRGSFPMQQTFLFGIDVNF